MGAYPYELDLSKSIHQKAMLITGEANVFDAVE